MSELKLFRSGAIYAPEELLLEISMDTTPTPDASAAIGGKNPAELALEVHNLLFPYPSEIRQRVIHSAMTLLGEEPAQQPRAASLVSATVSMASDEFSDIQIGSKALRWISRNGITRSMLDEVFHFTDGAVTISADCIPGASKREKTVNCYLLSGARGLLNTDVASFLDSDAMAECKRLACYDKNNHTTYRAAVGNKMTGKKPEFTLTVPGESAAADLVKQIAALRGG